MNCHGLLMSYCIFQKRMNMKLQQMCHILLHEKHIHMMQCLHLQHVNIASYSVNQIVSLCLLVFGLLDAFI